MDIAFKPVTFVYEQFLNSNPLALLGLLPFVLLYYYGNSFLRIVSFAWLALFAWIGFLAFRYGRENIIPVFTVIFYPILLIVTAVGIVYQILQ